MADKLLFCLEEIERLNLLVERAIARGGMLTRGDLTCAELEVAARRAERAARADPADAAVYRKQAKRLRQQLASLESATASVV